MSGKAAIVYGGKVGVPGKDQRICPDCNGSGVDPKFGYQPMSGCDRCSATGVIRERGERSRR